MRGGGVQYILPSIEGLIDLKIFLNSTVGCSSSTIFLVLVDLSINYELITGNDADLNPCLQKIDLVSYLSLSHTVFV